MKTLKFRCFSKELGKYLYSENFYDGNLSRFFAVAQTFKGCNIEQFTGLKDMNGSEIWEGDILDFNKTEWGGKFDNEVIDMNKLIGDFDYCGSFIDVSLWRTVVGNIHENPELYKIIE